MHFLWLHRDTWVDIMCPHKLLSVISSCDKYTSLSYLVSLNYISALSLSQYNQQAAAACQSLIFLIFIVKLLLKQINFLILWLVLMNEFVMWRHKLTWHGTINASTLLVCVSQRKYSWRPAVNIYYVMFMAIVDYWIKLTMISLSVNAAWLTPTVLTLYSNNYLAHFRSYMYMQLHNVASQLHWNH